ncbi:hypothetical protein E2986_13664 [Frieseomelitta varia]|uniref:Uncharacterized protein n=1 Tax=Frieseomelitta varia TaxID=561572 RepID=A0A833S1D1_9HYME|nr:hypothetical protein E2986_13664 [Frieseomelitta varia]
MIMTIITSVRIVIVTTVNQLTTSYININVSRCHCTPAVPEQQRGYWCAKKFESQGTDSFQSASNDKISSPAAALSLRDKFVRVLRCLVPEDTPEGREGSYGITLTLPLIGFFPPPSTVF